MFNIKLYVAITSIFYVLCNMPRYIIFFRFKYLIMFTNRWPAYKYLIVSYNNVSPFKKGIFNRVKSIMEIHLNNYTREGCTKASIKLP